MQQPWRRMNIDLNMVRAGDAEHPSEWAFSGYSEVPVRDGRWTESVAVGSDAFVAARKEKLGFKAKGRQVIEVNGSYEVRELLAPYNGILGAENPVLRPENDYFWGDTYCIST